MPAVTEDETERGATGEAAANILNPVYERRILQLQELMVLSGVDAMVLSHPSNIRYYTGFKGADPREREAYAVITPTGRFLVTWQLYFEKTPPTFEPRNSLFFDESMTEILRATDTTTVVGIEDDNMTVRESTALLALGVELKPVNAAQLRELKDEEEINEIRAACRAGDATFDYMVGYMRTHLQPGMTERQLREELEADMKRRGYYETAFQTIVAFGVNSADPHHLTDDTPLTLNNFITFDFGFVGEAGYRSDMTRTVFFGEPSEEQRRQYQAVLEAQQKVIGHVQERFAEGPETTIMATDLDAIARGHIQEAGYADEYFPHATGHGIGLDTHDGLRLNKPSTEVVRAGMVFSDEPGIYIPGEGGVRIEDLIAIHSDGRVEVLTLYPTELICIPAASEAQPAI